MVPACSCQCSSATAGMNFFCNFADVDFVSAFLALLSVKVKILNSNIPSLRRIQKLLESPL